MKLLKAFLGALGMLGAFGCAWTISAVLLSSSALTKFEQVGLTLLVAWWALCFAMDVFFDIANLFKSPSSIKATD